MWPKPGTYCILNFIQGPTVLEYKLKTYCIRVLSRGLLYRSINQGLTLSEYKKGTYCIGVLSSDLLYWSISQALTVLEYQQGTCCIGVLARDLLYWSRTVSVLPPLLVRSQWCADEEGRYSSSVSWSGDFSSFSSYPLAPFLPLIWYLLPLVLQD